MECSAVIYVQARNQKQYERIRYFIDPDTRPDFEEEVSKEEIECFKIFEFAEEPYEIIDSGNLSLTTRFDFVNEANMKSIMKGVALHRPKAMYMSFYWEGGANYYKLIRWKPEQVSKSDIPTIVTKGLK